MHQLVGTKGIFAQDGADWKSSRGLLRPNFDKAQVADLDRLELFFDQMRRKLEADVGEDRCVEIQDLYKKLTMDSASDFLVGSPVGALVDGGDDGFAPQSFSDAFDVAQATIATRWVLSNLYWIYNPKPFKAACAAARSMIRGYVATSLRVRAEKKKEEGQKRYVFLDALAESTQEPQVLQDQVLSVLLAGRDTTSMLLSWATLCLARHPDVLRKLRAAIETTVGLGAFAKIPTQEELRNITYLKWVLNESRTAPPSIVTSVI